MSRGEREKELHLIKQTIETMGKHNQVEIMQLFIRNNCHLSENQNGTFINISKLEPCVIVQVKEYLTYVEFQTEYLKEIEKKKELLYKKYFTNNHVESGPSNLASEQQPR